MGNRVDMLNSLDDKLGSSSRNERNNAIKDTPARIGFKVFNYIILAVLALVCLAPLWHILMLSFSHPTMIARSPGGLNIKPLTGYDSTGLEMIKNGVDEIGLLMIQKDVDEAGAQLLQDGVKYDAPEMAEHKLGRDITKDSPEVASHTGITKSSAALNPHKLSVTGGGYALVFANNSLIRGYANTIFYVGAGCLLSIAFAAVGAYCVSRRTMFGSYILIIMMVSMFFSGGMIPTYMVNKWLGLVNTRWVIILSGMLNVMNIIILMMAFRNLPQGLEESAQLDGAGHLTMLFKIALPLVKASIAVIALFYAIGKWNEYMTAQIYISNSKLYPLQIILRQILVDASGVGGESGISQAEIEATLGTEGNTKELVKYCTTIVGTVPLLCVYPFIQKYFVKGIMIGSMKG